MILGGGFSMCSKTSSIKMQNVNIQFIVTNPSNNKQQNSYTMISQDQPSHFWSLSLLSNIISTIIYAFNTYLLQRNILDKNIL